MDHPQNFEARDSKNSKGRNAGMLGPTLPSHFRLGRKERKCFVGSDEEAVTDFRAGFRGPGPLSGEPRREHSPSAGHLQTFVEPAMLLFPITWPDLHRLTGVEPLEGQSFDLVLCLLISADETLYVGFDGKPRRFRPGAQSCFDLGVEGDAHSRSVI